MQKKALLICAKDLIVSRGEQRVIEGLTLSVSAGETCLLSGSNGSGKTTLLMCLAGFLEADNGDCVVQDSHWVGVKNALMPELTVFENLMMFMANMSEEKVEAAIDAFLLAPYRQTRCKALSSGWSKRVSLARLLLSNHSVWLLDEPFVALDLTSRALLLDVMETHLDNGGGIVLASHLEVKLPGKLTRMELV